MSKNVIRYTVDRLMVAKDYNPGMLFDPGTLPPHRARALDGEAIVHTQIVRDVERDLIRGFGELLVGKRRMRRTETKKGEHREPLHAVLVREGTVEAVASRHLPYSWMCGIAGFAGLILAILAILATGDTSWAVMLVWSGVVALLATRIPGPYLVSAEYREEVDSVTNIEVTQIYDVEEHWGVDLSPQRSTPYYAEGHEYHVIQFDGYETFTDADSRLVYEADVVAEGYYQGLPKGHLK